MPTVRLQASTLESLETGMVLRLDMAAGTLAEWKVGGQTLAMAQPIRHGVHRAARIEETVREAQP